MSEAEETDMDLSIETKVIDLGTSMSRGFRAPRHIPKLIIVCPRHEDTRIPAQTIYINGIDSMKALRDLCNWVLYTGEEEKLLKALRKEKFWW
jgi:hypothetical protein